MSYAVTVATVPEPAQAAPPPPPGRRPPGGARRPATAPVLDVLAINPGIADATGAFAYIGYKGGSEPGVLNLTYVPAGA